MKSLVLNFEDEEFEMMQITKDTLKTTWHDLIPISIAEYFYQRMKQDKKIENHG